MAQAAVIGALRVNLGLDSAQFDKGLKNATTGLQRAGKQMQGFASTMTTALRTLTPFGAALSAAGLVQFARNTVSTTAALGDLADRLGVNVEALQQLRHAAGQSGASAADLDRGLTVLTAKLVEADKGTGAAAEQFQKLGIEVRDAEGRMKSADQVLVDLAEKLKGARTQSERAAIASRILGEDAGPRLAGLLAQGRDGLERLGKAAPVVRKELVEAAQRSDEEWRALMETITVGAQTMILHLVRLARLARELTPVSQQLGRITADIEKTEALLAKRRQIDDGEIGPVAGVPSAAFLERRLEALKRLRAEAEKETPPVPEVPPLPEVPPPPGRTRTGTGTARAAATSDAERQADAIAAVIDQLRHEQAQIGRTSREQAVHNALRAAGIDVTHESAEAVMELAAEVHSLEEASRLLDETIATGELYGFAPQVEKIAEATRDAGRAMEEFGDRVSSSFEAAVLEGKRLQDVLAGLLQDLARSGIRSAFGSIFGAIDFGSIFGGGGGLSVAAPAGLGSIGSVGFDPGTFGFANGGSFRVGGMGGTDSQLVAFRATPGEMVDVRTPGQMRDSGATTVNISMDARGAGPREVDVLRREMDRLKSDLPEIIKGNTIDARKRLGSMERTFRR